MSQGVRRRTDHGPKGLEPAEVVAREAQARPQVGCDHEDLDALEVDDARGDVVRHLAPGGPGETAHAEVAFGQDSSAPLDASKGLRIQEGRLGGESGLAVGMDASHALLLEADLLVVRHGRREVGLGHQADVVLGVLLEEGQCFAAEGGDVAGEDL